MIDACAKVATQHSGNQLEEYTDMVKRLVTTELERATVIVEGMKEAPTTTTTTEGKDDKKKKEKAPEQKDAKTLEKEAKAKIESLQSKASNIEDAIIKGLREQKGEKGE